MSVAGEDLQHSQVIVCGAAETDRSEIDRTFPLTLLLELCSPISFAAIPPEPPIAKEMLMEEGKIDGEI